MKPWFASAELVVASAAKDGTGRTVWRFPVLKDYLQHFQTLAGGAQSAMHGTCTSWTLFTIAKPDWWSALGSSRTLNMSFFKAAKESDVLRLRSEVSVSSCTTEAKPGEFCAGMIEKIVNIGTRMAMIQGVLLRESDGQIISTSEHHMVRAGPPGAKM